MDPVGMTNASATKLRSKRTRTATKTIVSMISRMLSRACSGSGLARAAAAAGFGSGPAGAVWARSVAGELSFGIIHHLKKTPGTGSAGTSLLWRNRTGPPDQPHWAYSPTGEIYLPFAKPQAATCVE